MDLVLESLELKNFMLIRESKIDFPEEGVIGILGRGMDDPERSNWLGKSTVLRAIKYNITGISGTTDDRKLIHYGQQSMETTTTWLDKDSGDRFVIRRGRDEKGNGIVEYIDPKNQGEKVAEANKLIEDLMGLRASDFDHTIFFKQDEINKFMLLSHAEKKKMLMSWQDNTHWTNIETKVLADLKVKKDLLKELRLKIENLEKQFGNIEEIKATYAESSIELKNTQDSLDNKRKELETLLVNQKITKEQHDSTIISRRNISEQYQQNKEAYLKETKIAENLESYSQLLLKSDEKDKLKSKLNTLLKEVGSNDALIESTKRFVDKLKKSKGGLCPILEESCDRIEISESEFKNKENLIEKLTKKQKDLKANSEEIEEKLKLAEFNENQYRKALDASKALKDRKEKLAFLKSKISEFNEIIDAYDSEISSKILDVRSEISSLSIRQEKYNTRLIRAKEHLKLIEENENKAQKLREEYQELSDGVEDLQYVAFACGKNGIPSLEIENSFGEIEDGINNILLKVANKELKFSPDRELKAWEENCLSCGFKFPKGYKKPTCQECNQPREKKRKDELSLSVVERGFEQDFDMCSGGLKTVISLAVRTQLAMLIRRQKGTNINILFLDEIDSALDPAVKSMVIDLVINILHKQLGFKQIFWISHDKTISHNVDKTLLIKGYKSYSKVEWL